MLIHKSIKATEIEIKENIECVGPKFNRRYSSNGKILDDILSEIDGQILNDKIDPTNYRFITLVGMTTTNHAVLDYGIGNGDFSLRFEKYEVLHKTCMSVYEKCYYHIPITL